MFSVTFGYEVTKILCNLCLHFARQDGQDGKNRDENHATKVNKIPKAKRRKYGMNETMKDYILEFEKYSILLKITLLYIYFLNLYYLYGLNYDKLQRLALPKDKIRFKRPY